MKILVFFKPNIAACYIYEIWSAYPELNSELIGEFNKTHLLLWWLPLKTLGPDKAKP